MYRWANSRSSTCPNEHPSKLISSRGVSRKGVLSGMAGRGRLPVHGHARRKQQSPEYRSWCAMHARCYQKNCKDFPDYGGRGIRVCARWRTDFSAFLADMGRRPSNHIIERKDPNGPYDPMNCQWAHRSTASRNTRRNIWITHRGERLILADWARQSGIPEKTLWQRIRLLGWSTELALTFPTKRRQP